MKVLFVLLSILGIALAWRSYAGYSVVEVDIRNQDSLRDLEDLVNQGDDVRMWGNFPPRMGSNRILVSSLEILSSLKKSIKSIIHEDIEPLVNAHLKNSMKNSDVGDDWFKNYHDLDDISALLDQMAAKYPDLCSVFTLDGATYQGRTQKGIKIGSNMANPVLFFEGGVHAREWISPAVMSYFTYYLLANYTQQGAYSTRDIVDSFVFVIIPVTNPDGYVYTWENDRLWRKNLFPTGTVENGTQCIGVDLNRNWNYSFSSDDPHPDPCGESYPGKAGFDQPETLALTQFIQQISTTQPIYLYIDWHSCGQLWMYPWAFSANQAPFWNKQNNLGSIAINALSSLFGTQYTLGPIAVTIYEVGGSSADWTFDVMNIIYSYGVELRDTGNYCFVLPPDQIIPTGQETLAGVVAMARYLIENPPCN